MHIQPNTNVRILAGVPLTSDYQNTLYFGSTYAQEQYFNSKVKYHLPELTYQKVSKGVMRVQLKTEQLYNCNYMMFQNSSFSNKWFYAFIDNVEYVNNVTSEISYTIDVIQTFLFDFRLLPSFVEREHSDRDTIGYNTVPEQLETGPYITTNTVFRSASTINVYMLTTEPIPAAPVSPTFTPSIIGGLPMPCYGYYLGQLPTFFTDLMTRLLEKIAESGKNDMVISIFCTPVLFTSSGAERTTTTFQGARRVLSKTPKNKKLYTYPYCANVLVCGGQAVELKYELFSSAPTFQTNSGFGANLKVAVTPLNYAGNDFDIEHTCSLSGFPLLPWTKDYYQNWLAQNKASLIYSTVKDVVNIGSAIYSKDPTKIAGAAGNVNNIANTLINVYQHSIIPDTMAGSADAADSLIVSGRQGVYNYCRSIRPEYVDIIDRFFTVYGYATHKVKIPNTAVRPEFTYTKTKGCNLTADIPHEYSEQIKRVFDNGVTFWKNPEHVGNYDVDNTVV